MVKLLWVQNIVRDVFASVRDVVGGRVGAYESKLKDARDIAMGEMKELAKEKVRTLSLVLT